MNFGINYKSTRTSCNRPDFSSFQTRCAAQGSAGIGTRILVEIHFDNHHTYDFFAAASEQSPRRSGHGSKAR